MFYNNDVVETETGWVVACRVAKIAGNQFPTVVRVPLGYVQCHAEPMEQIEGALNRGVEVVNDVAGVFGIK
jgi:hypothetical protein